MAVKTTEYSVKQYVVTAGMLPSTNSIADLETPGTVGDPTGHFALKSS